MHNAGVERHSLEMIRVESIMDVYLTQAEKINVWQKYRRRNRRLETETIGGGLAIVVNLK